MKIINPKLQSNVCDENNLDNCIAANCIIGLIKYK